MVSSVEVTWQLDGISMEGTLVRPDGAGPFPTVVLVAGSGPTDRDWCSPLLPGNNGSGRLFADAFARAGIASLRYDKRASGPHARENVPKLIGKVSMRSHLDELVAAVDVLSQWDFVDSARIAGLGNSEGTLHVLHYATSIQAVPFVGVVLAAPPGRPVQAVLLSQLTTQSAQVPRGAELMAKVEEAAARYSVGQPMDVDAAVPDSVKMVLASFEAPVNLPLARELWVESACESLAKLQIPALVLIGGNDVQIDIRADGDPLQNAARGLANVSFAFPPHANHVFKEDPRSRVEVVAAPGGSYNDPDTRLDPESLEVILGWLEAVFNSDSRSPRR
ncbi:alpha/beta hydrolase family protein [Rathayibacter soli]|uniref:alpha/beta hydrolase family protein n=1 Tax=Rathayibacter soli TaxID=3144168 RepID=UPI0027E40648|nr:alpha/beta fold hydrolase [Glaciibacter superstes]